MRTALKEQVEVAQKNPGVTTVYVALVGRGNVGRTLLAQIVAAQDELRRRGVDLRMNAVIGRSGAYAASDGIEEGTLARVFEGRDIAFAEQGEPLGWERISATLDEVAAPGQIVIDATAEDNADIHVGWHARGWHVVTANKKPITSSLAHYDALVGTSHRDAGQYRYETTCGAGLPVIGTLRDIITSGDRIVEIRAAVSGTLGFICSACEDGMPFADAVREAKAKGFTEPDPRQDLSGADVARKALIMARLAGRRDELSSIVAESLVPDALEGVDRDTFLRELDAHSASVDERFRAAAANGNVLRYLLAVTPEGIRVALTEVAKDGPFGTLRGPENLFVIRTARYDANPLVIKGPGAGGAVTAAGLFGDLLRVIGL